MNYEAGWSTPTVPATEELSTASLESRIQSEPEEHSWGALLKGGGWAGEACVE